MPTPLNYEAPPPPKRLEGMRDGCVYSLMAIQPRSFCAVLGALLVVILLSLHESASAEPAVDAACIGRYELEPGRVLRIMRFRDQLYGRMTDGQAYPMIRLDAKRFSFDDKAVLTIETDSAGKVNGVRFDRGDFHKAGPKVSDDPWEIVALPDALDSPRMAALAAELARGNGDALKQFWRDVQDKAPLVEPIAVDPKRSWVTFLYRGDADTRTVRLDGGPCAFPGDGTATNLKRLGDTDLWYRTMRMPNDARFAYAFGINSNVQMPYNSEPHQRLFTEHERADALNPKFLHAYAAGDEFPALSILEMPDAPPQPYVKPVEGNPKGTVVDHTIESAVLKQTRKISVYTPPGFDAKAGTSYPLIVLFDGYGYHRADHIPGDTIIDNLIAAKKIAPPVVLFINANERTKELNCSESFAAFVAKELVPWMRSNYHATSDAAQTTIGGLSLGGVMAAYCALHHPDTFGNVISQSGAFWVYPGYTDEVPPLSREGALATDFLKSPKLPIRFYLEAGRFENFAYSNILTENRRLRDVLLAKGYDVTYSEYSGGHSFINWRGSLADGLIALQPSAPAK